MENITEEEVDALRQAIGYMNDQKGLSHRGYYSQEGWVGRHCASLLRKLSKKPEHNPFALLANATIIPGAKE